MRLRCRFPEHVGVRGRDGPKVVSTMQVKGGAYVDRYLVIGKCDSHGWVARQGYRCCNGFRPPYKV